MRYSIHVFSLEFKGQRGLNNENIRGDPSTVVFGDVKLDGHQFIGELR
jgi:hypothetical protein